MELHDKHVVITGASGGLGGAVVTALLGSGATCHLPIAEPDAPQGIAWLERPRVHSACGVDLADSDAVDRFYDALPPIWASVHLVGGFTMAPVASTAWHDVDRMLTLNTRTSFLCSMAAIRSMRAHGNGGRIVNVAARPALQPVPGLLAYTIAKAAVVAMTQSLAIELRDEGILVNAIAPSIIDTPANRRAMPDADFDSWPKPAELASAIEFLVSPKNRVTSGCVMPVYGRA